MRLIRKSDIILAIIFFLFSWWLMDKSFGYNPVSHQFRIARHQIGDFGLHLSLIRSFSWGNNFPPQLPFFPGRSLPYHYGFDLTVGLLERLGVRIDIAFNGLSAIAFAVLLFFIYKLSQVLFGKSISIGLLSVILFIFHSNLTFLDFFKAYPLSRTILRDLWYLPDYLHKGPFDGSQISLFFTLNTYLNQRHLIVALAVSLGVLLYLLPRLLGKKAITAIELVGVGIAIGMISWIHSLVFAGNLVVVGMLFFLFGRIHWLVPVIVPAVSIAMPRLFTVIKFREPELSYQLFNPGFLSPHPLNLAGFVSYWWSNLGFALPMTVLGVMLSPKKARMVFYAILPLFIIANVFQLSYRMDHNHTLINYFLIVANGYIAYGIVQLWKKAVGVKIVTVILIFFLTASGVVDLMAAKNDFQSALSDALADKLMEWIRINTDPKAVFLSREDILDPITLSGRFNYFGATYYPEVMGYPIQERRRRVVRFFETRDTKIFPEMRQEGIDYVVIPVKPPSNFRYQVDPEFFANNLREVYSDGTVFVYRL